MTLARRMAMVVACLVLLALPAAASAADTTVHITDAPSFDPIEVTVTAGGSVTWVNDHSFTHDAASMDNTWATRKLDQGQSATVTFKTVGSYEYLCTLHPLMRGTVTVLPAPAPPDTATLPYGDRRDGPNGLVILVAGVAGALIALRRFRTASGR